MDKNFRVRFMVGFCLFTLALVTLYTFDAIPFRLLFSFFSVIAAIELISFYKRQKTYKNLLLVIMELGFLFYGTLFVMQIDVPHFWYVILGVPGYDIFAYLSGKMIGGKIFKKSRPFPRISKNKTWEGTICGLLMAVGMVAVLMAVRGAFASDWMYLFCGPLALIGDLIESLIKRKFKVKDSNEIVIKNKFFKRIEILVGGKYGHGGFLDRVDSSAFTMSILLIISLFL